MKARHFLFYVICTLLFTGCKSQSNRNSSKAITDQKLNHEGKGKTIYLYSVDSVFLPYMPDTNKIFRSSESRRNYFLVTEKRYRDFRNSYSPRDKTDDEIILEKRNADIMFDDYMDLINFKFAKDGHKNKETMTLLSFYSPYSNSSQLRERMSLINSYPEQIKASEIGKKTIAELDEYSNNKNIGLNFHTFSSINITDIDLKEILLNKIFVPEKKYQIIIFGASWCLPCKLEELQLTYWIQMIDTSLIKITSFSIDKSMNSWKKYIHTNNFPWQCFLIEGEMNNPMIKQLGFAGIPRNFLLDEKGVILFENTDLRKILKKIPYIRTNSNYINNGIKE